MSHASQQAGHAGHMAERTIFYFARRHAVTVLPSTQTDGTRVGQSLDYAVHLHNLGFNADSYTVGVSGHTFTTTVLDPTCTTPLTTTPAKRDGAAIDHATTREQFGVPIGSFQAIQHLLADQQVSFELS